ncbi:MAG TPA: response regulator [Clostridiales bacterium]|nr:response regulator [Clostridiales bacterium]HQP70683.1 response regulator [Clostridiales bacterium]
MNSQYILIVDDDTYDVELSLRALEGLFDPKELVVCSDGAEALDLLLNRGRFAGKKRIVPTFILADKKMPKMDGFELLDEIRRRDEIKHIPYVLFTSSNYEKDIEEAYQKGANAYVVKPINTDEYFKTVKLSALFWTSANRSVSFNDSVL